MTWKTWLHIAERLAPIVLATVPGIPPALVGPLSNMIMSVQQIEGKAGPDKKALVMAAATDVGATPDQLTAISSGIDTAVSVINLVHGQHGLEIAAAAAPATLGK